MPKRQAMAKDRLLIARPTSSRTCRETSQQGARSEGGMEIQSWQRSARAAANAAKEKLMAAYSDRVFPALRWKAITPTDNKVLEPVPAAIMVSVDGNVAMIGDDGVSATFPLTAGTVYPMQPIIISATSTTATGIIGLYN